MDIRNRNALKLEAAAALSGARHEKQIICFYFGITTALSLVVMVADMLLGNAVSGTGGLSNLGTRSVLQTAQTVLPYVQMLLVMCLDMGYLRCAMDMSREKDPDAHTLQEGFQLFWPTLRLNLLLSAIYVSLAIVSFYLGMQIFLFTPFAAPLVEAVNSMSTSVLSDTMAVTDSVMDVAYDAALPMLAICLLLYLVLALPVVYRYRMASYCLLDQPRAGALAAMRKSKMMMRRNRFNLFKLDLSFWWYYLLGVLAQVVCYGDVILPMLGVQLPFSDTVGYYLFYGLYVVILFIISYCFRSYTAITYVKAYEALCPPEAPPASGGGVVLGNIFDM